MTDDNEKLDEGISDEEEDLIDELEDVDDETLEDVIDAQAQLDKARHNRPRWKFYFDVRPYDYIKIYIPAVAAKFGYKKPLQTKAFREWGIEGVNKYLINQEGELYKQEYKKYPVCFKEYSGEMNIGLGKEGMALMKIKIENGETKEINIDGEVIYVQPELL